MRDIAAALLAWHLAGERYAVATVIEVRGSAPRPVGATLAVRADGTVIGSVSGGCVEGAVYELAMAVLASGVPVRERFGYSAEDAFAVGLTCGGELTVFVQPSDPSAGAVLGAVVAGRSVGLATVVAGPPDRLGRTLAVLPDGVVDDIGVAGIGDLLANPDGIYHHAGMAVFVRSISQPARLLVFGAIDHAAALTVLGRHLGYHVTVCDARPVFATPQRFPAAHEVVVDWPHRYLARTGTDHRTVLCVLTHDPKFDVPVLVDALRRPLAYVGALGSRRTHADRLARLRAAGLTEAELARLRSPIGLDLGAQTPEEVSVSIAAEIIAVRTGAGGRALSTTDGPIHRLATIDRSA